MKTGIHPAYEPTKIHCACGNVVDTRSTKKALSVEACSKCHPFYTGEQKFMDAAGKIEKYRKKYGQTKV
ncbi:MAG: 50S ribosomal protein L31 [Deltaproteobacteria bacterium]